MLTAAMSKSHKVALALAISLSAATFAPRRKIYVTEPQVEVVASATPHAAETVAAVKPGGIHVAKVLSCHTVPICMLRLSLNIHIILAT